MQTTNISWADYTWNPATGCSHQGPECWNCYAETFSRRQGRTSDPWTQEHASENVTQHPSRLDEPSEYHYPEGPGRVFVGSMTDMFHRELDPSYVQDVLDVCRQHPQHVWIFLTKRPHHAARWRLDWPDNTWLGTSVGSGPGGQYRCTTHRIEQLRDVDVTTRWVSFEPLIEPVGDVALDHIDWAVVGGETAPAQDRREMDHTWAVNILGQCREADVAFYFKQSSGRYPERGTELAVPADGEDFFAGIEKREIREYPPLPDVVQAARQEVTTIAE